MNYWTIKDQTEQRTWAIKFIDASTIRRCPSNDAHKLSSVAGQAAAKDGVIAVDHKLITNPGLIVLQHR